MQEVSELIESCCTWRRRARSYNFVQEISFRGTACTHPKVPEPSSADGVVTSSLSEFDQWNLIDAGYIPVGIVSRCAVYNVGVGGHLASLIDSAKGGEVDRYNEILRDARQQVMMGVREDCLRLGGEEIIGLELDVHNVADGLLEFHACE